MIIFSSVQATVRSRERGAGERRGPELLCVFTALRSAADVNGSTENKNWWCRAESAAATAVSVHEAMTQCAGGEGVSVAYFTLLRQTAGHQLRKGQERT